MNAAAAISEILQGRIDEKADTAIALHREQSGRDPFGSIEDACQCADHVRAVRGWSVVEVLGWRPGGPPRTRRHTPYSPPPAARVPRVPPTVKAIGRSGQVVNIGSWSRWLSIRPWGET